MPMTADVRRVDETLVIFQGRGSPTQPAASLELIERLRGPFG
jgi:hypothetical protein